MTSNANTFTTKLITAKQIRAAIFCAVFGIAPTISVATEINPSLADVYVRRPDLFVDKETYWLDRRPDAWQPASRNRWWYVRLNDRLSGYDGEAMAAFVMKYQLAGLDLSEQKLLGAPYLIDLTKPDGVRDLLRVLMLKGTAYGDKSIPYLCQLRALEILRVGERVTDAGLPGLACFQDRLVELGLSGTQVTDSGLPALSGMRLLQILDLTDTAVTPAGLQALTKLPIKQLRLGSAITDDASGPLSQIPSLSQLDLSQTKMSDQGLGFLSKLPKLHTLFLNAAITDRGLKLVAGVTSLRRLDLTGAKITDAGVQRLAALKDLEELALGQSGVTDAGLNFLSSLPKLRYLEVSNTALTREGLKNVARLPALQVFSFSWKGKLTLGDLKPLGQLPALKTLIVNGKTVSRREMDYIQGRSAPKKSRRGMSLISFAWAENDAPLSDDTEVDLTPAKGRRPFKIASSVGLQRIHAAESELDHMIPVVSDPAKEGTQETEANFLGEFTINSGSPKKIKR